MRRTPGSRPSSGARATPSPEGTRCGGARWARATAVPGPARRARRAAGGIGATASGAYGFFRGGGTEAAIASSTGVRLSQPMTDAMTLVIAAGDGCSGYAEATSWRAASLEPAGVARRAAETAARTYNAADAAPGRYRAVLEPYALAVLLEYFGWDSFGAQG